MRQQWLARRFSAAEPLVRARDFDRQIVWLIRCWRVSVVTRMAFMMARSRAEPWAFITVPFRPSSGAPP